MIDKSKEVETLIDRAAKTPDSGDAMKFSQAACNVANAMCSVREALQNLPPERRGS